MSLFSTLGTRAVPLSSSASSGSPQGQHVWPSSLRIAGRGGAYGRTDTSLVPITCLLCDFFSPIRWHRDVREGGAETGIGNWSRTVENGQEEILEEGWRLDGGGDLWTYMTSCGFKWEDTYIDAHM